MTISSRTPEGQPNVCPVCGHDVKVDPSHPFGDATCPHCGQLLMFATSRDGVVFSPRPPDSDLKRTILEELAFRWNIPISQLEEHPAFQRLENPDSLDLVEAIMELEDDFGNEPPTA